MNAHRARRDTADFDLTTPQGRYYARKCGLDVPKLRLGGPPSDFWSHVEKTETCWNWTGGLNYGYGSCTVDGRTRRAHRHAWEMANGPIPDGLQVMHLCDNRRCVRLEHLQLGTGLDNMRDASRKGRIAHGERNSKTRLTADDVRAIRANHRRGNVPGEWSTGWIAKRYGIDPSSVRSIVRRINWRFVE